LEDLFYWYKNARTSEPIGGCDLKESKIDSSTKVGTKECFSILSSQDDGELFVGYLTSESTREGWVDILTKGQEQDPHPFPAREEVKSKKRPSWAEQQTNYFPTLPLPLSEKK